ncbi:MAG: 3-hydroxyacyl-CoA dehydrogenase NAD-binding domain-containing protein [Acidobacteriota bacterium]
MSEPVHLRIDESGVGWLVLDVPGEKVNVLSMAVMECLEARCRDAAAARDRIRGLVIASGKEGSFIAGADVSEIGRITDPAEATALAARGQAVFQGIADLPFPTAAAVNGVCLGGGMELILACDLRLAADDGRVRLGLPEVRLGILPGFGGTQRLPRLVGLGTALDLILTGRNLDAGRARRAGLVDRVVPPEYLRREAASLALLAADRGVPAAARRRGRGLMKTLLEGNPIGRSVVFRAARKRVARTAGPHYPAPPRILTSIANAYRLPLARGLAEEARLVGELVAGDVSKNLIGLFQATNAIKKRTGVSGDVRPRDVDRAGLLGAGTMGGGIAWLLARNGVPVRMKDIRHEALAAGMEAAAGIFGRAVKRRRMKPREMERAMGAISPTLDYSGFATVDAVIEAVVEKLEVKWSVLTELEAEVSEGCVLASNTSSLPITTIASRLRRPERFVGMHFFNPVDRMPLVEVIRGERSDDVAVATIYSLAKRLGKMPVVVRDGPGFLVNRILAPYMNEAVLLVRDGASIAAVDRALMGFGMPMGPLALFDQVGIDVAAHVAGILREAFGERMGDASGLDRMIREKRLGKKSGRGFYRYGEKRPEPDPEVTSWLREGDAPAPGTEAITERCVLRMLDEASRCVEDGIVSEPGDLDLAMILGTGFPPFRGGLLRHGDTLGAAAVVERLEALAAALGPRFEPCDLLRRAARDGLPLRGTG